MSGIAIQAAGLGKRYRLGHRAAGYKTLREVVVESLQAPARWWGGQRRGRGAAEELWALHDTEFTIQQGEVVGLIGRNGAGKSTLLKLLSRITEPTTGYAEIRGRVGSLLEVGTGFHPELTGRENIYLNGAILGMARAEIVRKFDEIVAFAEVERFLDTAVKHYSSGMYLRLAFAVAAHLEPEILMVDEVLAVGDAAFQKKCLDKMQDVGQAGRTVVFVSHNMPAITRLCERAILLDEGTVKEDGPAAQVVGAYLRAGLGTTAEREWSVAAAPGQDVARLRAVRVRAADGTVSDTIDIRQPVAIEMDYEVLTPGHQLMPHFSLFTEESIHAFSAHDVDPEWRRRPRPAGQYTSRCHIPGNFLAEGMLFVYAGCETFSPTIHQFGEKDAVAFHVFDSLDGDSARGDYGGRLTGVVRPLLKWETECCSLDAQDRPTSYGEFVEADYA